MNNQAIVIFGATSAVAQELARIHAKAGDSIFLIARNTDRLKSVENDLLTRGSPKIESITCDLDDIENHTDLLQSISDKFEDISKYYFFYGVLPDQEACEGSYEETNKAITTNFLSVVSLLTQIANKVEKETNRGIIAVSSVAGDRGRQSNYIYGTAKGALTIYLQGLRNRLYKSNCTVTTIKPGFIDTPMTSDFKKGALWATPEKVAKDTYNAAMKGKNEIYSPGFWMFIMLIIKNIPETIFKRLSL
ncbi:MAG: SDR family oxidoreductase [Cocleimonas sp.]